MLSLKDEPTTAERPCGGPQTFATFRLKNGLFGIATNVVKEVTALPPLTPIPHAPVAIRGYVNLRGQIVLVVDLNCLLQRELTPPDAETRLVVFQPELGDALGVFVERIGEIVKLDAAQIESLHAGQASDRSDVGTVPEEELICGVGKLDGELLLILDAPALLACLERAVSQRGQDPFVRPRPEEVKACPSKAT